jgi:CobQ-like glutamine amidotransferase family enzyme
MPTNSRLSDLIVDTSITKYHEFFNTESTDENLTKKTKKANTAKIKKVGEKNGKQ